jgi:hypothetical protein
MAYEDEFERRGESSDDLIGPPDAISSAIGHIVLVFGRLDAYVSATLLRLLDGDPGWGQLLTTTLSVEEKLALLDERVRLLAPTGPSTPAPATPSRALPSSGPSVGAWRRWWPWSSTPPWRRVP